jgi:hypothetical protein
MRPSNVIVVRDREFALAGQGLYKTTPPPQERTAYDAPELERTGVTEATDIYSFAFIALFVLARKVPSGRGVARLASGLRPDLPDSTPRSLDRLVRHCWTDDPSKRYTAENLVLALASIELDAAKFDRNRFLCFARKAEPDSLARSHFVGVQRETIRVGDRISKLIEKVEQERGQLKELLPKTQKEIHDEVAAVRVGITAVQKRVRESNEVFQGLRQTTGTWEQKVSKLRIDRDAIKRLERQIAAAEEHVNELERPPEESEPLDARPAPVRRVVSKS